MDWTKTGWTKTGWTKNGSTVCTAPPVYIHTNIDIYILYTLLKSNGKNVMLMTKK